MILMQGWGRVREDEGCSFPGFSFSACIKFYFAFENQNDRFDKQQNICFKREHLILKTFKGHVFLHGHADYEKIG